MAHGFNGNPVIPPGLPGQALVKIGPPITILNQSYVDFLNVFDKNFQNFKIKGWDISVGTNSDDIQANMYIEGAIQTANYFGIYNYLDSATPTTLNGSAPTTKIALVLSASNNAGAVCDFEMDINNPNGTTKYKNVSYKGSFSNPVGASVKTISGSSTYNAASVRSPIYGMRFQASTGLISGTFQLYGYV